MCQAWMQYFDLSKLRCIHSTLWDPKWCLGEFYTVLLNFRHIRWKTCVSSLNTLFRGTEVVKHPFYSNGPKMMFGSVLNHFANLRHVKRWKTCVSARNALFQDTKIAKHPFDYIGPKVMFESVSEHFTNLWHVKRCESCVLGQNALLWVPKLRSIHSTPYDSKCGLEVFQSISLTISM
jgi:hypothetical protein